MSGGGSNGAGAGGFWSLVVFLLALVAGTMCSLTSKMLLNMESIGLSGEMELFSFPLFQTFGMFLGMAVGLVLHFVILHGKYPFPGYDHDHPAKRTPMWMYLILFFPAIFDLIATSLCMFGLKYVNVSIYQMLRGSAIVFVAIIKQFILKDKLTKFMWVGIFWNVVSIVLVGLTAILISSSGDSSSTGESDPLLGVLLILAGAFVQSLQYAFEEKVMSVADDSDMVATPPLLLIGMEGLWGLIICVLVLYPLAYYTPGADHGSVENPFNTYVLISNSSEIQNVFIIYFISVLAYNILACLVTFMLSAIWHAILDNFRPITVWAVDLFIFYTITTSFGESWSAQWSWLQVFGMVVLLYGTAVYNVPNPGSIRLTGRALDCFIDCSDEYDEVEESRLDQEYLLKTGNSIPASPYYSNMSPFMSPSQAIAMRIQQKAEEARALELAQRNYGGV